MALIDMSFRLRKLSSHLNSVCLFLLLRHLCQIANTDDTTNRTHKPAAHFYPLFLKETPPQGFLPLIKCELYEGGSRSAGAVLVTYTSYVTPPTTTRNL